MNTINDAIRQFTKRYHLASRADYVNALKEIIQEIALLGLWRSKFFEHAAFYGGTALRILYGLDRFSEDLDFSLLEPNPHFKLDKYHDAIVNELISYGLTVTIERREKTTESKVESAFVKANTVEHLLLVGAQDLARGHKEEKVKIKIEVDTDPPPGFSTETQFLLEPSAFSVLTLVPEDLFAGKMHALLCRNWKKRVVKGRDWYDLVWYIRKKIPLNLNHLEQRMRQSGHLETATRLSEAHFHQLLREKIEQLDIQTAKQDVIAFVKSADQVEVWSKEFFFKLVPLIPLIAQV